MMSSNSLYSTRILWMVSSETYISTPVRALHASFYNFLADPVWSMEFAIKMEDIHCQLTWACVRVMKTGLCFNICQLETLYCHIHTFPSCNSGLTLAHLTSP